MKRTTRDQENRSQNFDTPSILSNNWVLSGSQWRTLLMNIPWGPTGLGKLPEKKESQCCVSSTKMKWKRSTTICSRCSRDPHRQCFLKYNCRLYTVCTAALYKKLCISETNITETKFMLMCVQINICSCSCSDKWIMQAKKILLAFKVKLSFFKFPFVLTNFYMWNFRIRTTAYLFHNLQELLC
jgi:hypothetical protein